MILFSFNLAHAQFAENNAIYATGELNLGNYIGGKTLNIKVYSPLKLHK